MTQKLKARHRAPSRPSTPVSQFAQSFFSSENGKRLSALAGSGVALTVVAAAAVPASADATAAKLAATAVNSGQLAKGTVEKLTVNEAVTSEVEKVADSATSAQVGTPAPTADGNSSSASSAEAFVGRDLGPADGTAVGIAMQYQGSPYVWGGTTPSGFDCSGFVGYVYRQMGKSLPRTTGAMMGAGQVVPLSQIQPGDVLLSPTHAGIYVGNGQAIHALSPAQGVQVTPMSWGSFTTARRF
ncbi:C40 family peptidase [Varibaculum vaginae]|uniref:C40 family peptidase n=1 Tax=Varibaculum vaginae TaxID=2364797 RepID=UPI00190F3AAF|nr:C40 family peptidase [Varibaculum vaginae]